MLSRKARLAGTEPHFAGEGGLWFVACQRFPWTSPVDLFIYLFNSIFIQGHPI